MSEMPRLCYVSRSNVPYQGNADLFIKKTEQPNGRRFAILLILKSRKKLYLLEESCCEETREHWQT